MTTMTPTPMAFNNPNHTPEIQALLRAVEETFGRSVASTSHFTALSYTIESVTGNYMSDSTLKRLWNYVPSAAAPRISTLDILSQYAGYRNFNAFCDKLRQDNKNSSEFFTSVYIASEDIPKDGCIEFGWSPDRLVTLRHLGECRFRVESSRNSKLQPGDEFETASFMTSYPLYISRILRKGEWTSSFVAGKNGGLTVLRLL